VKIYTKKGDDGSTGLFYGGRVRKDETGPAAYGAVDEAVAAMGVARALAADTDPDLAATLLAIQREMFIVAAELATAPRNHHKLEPGVSRPEPVMIERLETAIDVIVDDRGMPTEFVVPGANHLAAALDVARTVVRRAERHVVTHTSTHGITDTLTVVYLNRLADYLWMAARNAEESWTSSKDTPSP
jgi:cob(I)alamin adenosyltransferase